MGPNFCTLQLTWSVTLWVGKGSSWRIRRFCPWASHGRSGPSQLTEGARKDCRRSGGGGQATDPVLLNKAHAPGASQNTFPGRLPGTLRSQPPSGTYMQLQAAHHNDPSAGSILRYPGPNSWPGLEPLPPKAPRNAPLVALMRCTRSFSESETYRMPLRLTAQPRAYQNCAGRDSGVSCKISSYMFFSILFNPILFCWVRSRGQGIWGVLAKAAFAA